LTDRPRRGDRRDRAGEGRAGHRGSEAGSTWTGRVLDVISFASHPGPNQAGDSWRLDAPQGAL